jgi:ribosomal subunit interface protein
MEIRVAGHQINTGEALQAHASERLTAVVEKYFNRALSSTVTFGRAPAGAFRCDIVTHVMQGLVLKGAGIAQDAHVAFDQAADKIDKQLRRYKRRLTARR